LFIKKINFLELAILIIFQHFCYATPHFLEVLQRFLIDDKDVYHIGASLKDLGKKWFAFSKLDKSAFELLENLKKVRAYE